MFSINKPPPPPPPEQNGIKLEVKLSEATLIKLASIAIPVLFGAGVLVVQSNPLPQTPSDNGVEAIPNQAQ